MTSVGVSCFTGWKEDGETTSWKMNIFTPFPRLNLSNLKWAGWLLTLANFTRSSGIPAAHADTADNTNEKRQGRAHFWGIEKTTYILLLIWVTVFVYVSPKNVLLLESMSWLYLSSLSVLLILILIYYLDFCFLYFIFYFGGILVCFILLVDYNFVCIYF